MPIIIEHSIQVGNDNSVVVTGIICGALVAIALIVVGAILLWHNLNDKYTEQTKKDEWEHERDRLEIEHAYEKIAQQYKEKKDNISKLVTFREELSKKDSKMKEVNDTACKQYIDLLTNLSGIDKVGS